MRRAMTMIVMVLFAADARAGGIVFERDAGAHEAAVTRLLGELERGGDLIARPDSVRRALGIAAVAPEGVAADRAASALAAHAAAGYQAYLDGRYSEAIELLGKVVDEGHANALQLAWSVKARAALLDALVGLATSYQRRAAGGDTARAITTMHELIRSFPERGSLRGDYGPEPDALYREALAALRAHGTGTLAIDSDDAGVQIFVDEREQTERTIALLPGTYRVLVTGRAASNRRYDVVVRAGETTHLPLRAAIGRAFQASDAWVGFVGADDAAALAYARTLAQAIGRDPVVLVGERTWRGGPAIAATVARGGDVRRYVIALDTESGPRIAALARVVRGATASDPLVADLQQDEAPPPPPAPVASHGEDEPDEDTPPPSARPSPHVVAAGGLGVVGLVGGVLAVRFAGQARDAAERVDELCAVRCTKAQVQPLVDENARARRNAIVSGVIGGAAIAGGAALLWYVHQRHLIVTPHGDGATVSYVRSF